MKKLLACSALALAIAGCGGGGGSSSGPNPTPTPTPTPTSTSTAPIPNPSPIPIDPLPNVPFDVRGRVFVGSVATAGILVTAIGDANATTGLERTITDATGRYSFFLGAGSYTLSATRNGATVTRAITVPAGGQTVDNVNLNL